MPALTGPLGLVLAHTDGLGMGLALAVVAFYAHGIGAKGARPPPWRAASLLAGVVVILVALSPPMGAASMQFFSAHMSQHLLLILVAAPLIVLGRPAPVVLRALPRRFSAPIATVLGTLRRRISRRHSAVVAVAAWLLHAVTLWAWHVPALYDAALHNPWIHGLEHATMLLGAMPMWMVVLTPLRATGLPGIAAVPYLFTTSLHSGALGALLVFAPSPWYDHLRYAPAGGDIVADQQMAGLIMWMPGALVYLGAALAVFGVWMARRPQPALRLPSPVERPPADHQVTP